MGRGRPAGPGEGPYTARRLMSSARALQFLSSWLPRPSPWSLPLKEGQMTRNRNTPMITERELRSEVIENFYHLENGLLVLRPHHVDVPGWPSGEAEKYTPILLESFDRGGWF